MARTWSMALLATMVLMPRFACASDEPVRAGAEVVRSAPSGATAVANGSRYAVQLGGGAPTIGFTNGACIVLEWDFQPGPPPGIECAWDVWSTQYCTLDWWFQYYDAGGAGTRSPSSFAGLLTENSAVGGSRALHVSDAQEAPYHLWYESYAAGTVTASALTPSQTATDTERDWDSANSDPEHPYDVHWTFWVDPPPFGEDDEEDPGWP